MTPRHICTLVSHLMLSLLLPQGLLGFEPSVPTDIKNRQISIESAELVSGDEGLYRHTASITPRPTDVATVRFSWTDHASSFGVATIIGDRVVLLGKVENAGDAIAILSIREQRELTFVLCRDPKMSPDGSKVAYLQFEPRHPPTAPISDAVLVLKTTSDIINSAPNTGEPNDLWVHQAAGHGKIVFPSSLSGSEYVPAIADQKLFDRDLVVTALQWIDDRRLMFVVQDSDCTLTVVFLGSEIRDSKSSTSKITPLLFGATPNSQSFGIRVKEMKLVSDKTVQVTIKPNKFISHLSVVVPIPEDLQNAP